MFGLDRDTITCFGFTNSEESPSLKIVNAMDSLVSVRFNGTPVSLILKFWSSILMRPLPIAMAWHVQQKHDNSVAIKAKAL